MPIPKCCDFGNKNMPSFKLGLQDGTRGRASEDEQCSVNSAICKTEKQDHDPVFSGQEDDRTV